MTVQRKQVLRRCTGCGERKEKRELIRVVRTPEGEILLDESGRQNGRGAYLCKSAECLQKAAKNKGLSRTLKEAVPKEVLDRIEKEISGIE